MGANDNLIVAVIPSGGGGGTGVEFDIETSVPYALLGTEDNIKLSGTGTLTLISTALATKSFTVFAATGTITIVLVDGDTTNQITITQGNSARYTPFTGEWTAT